MALFRKKPIVIEALRFMGPFSYDEMLDEWGDHFRGNIRIGVKFALAAICLMAPMSTLPQNPEPRCGEICEVLVLGGSSCVVTEKRPRLTWCDHWGNPVKFQRRGW